jgi:hypothetical protein
MVGVAELIDSLGEEIDRLPIRLTESGESSDRSRGPHVARPSLIDPGDPASKPDCLPWQILLTDSRNGGEPILDRFTGGLAGLPVGARRSLRNR